MKVECWTRLALQLPPRSGKYRVRNYDCEESVGHYVAPEDDEGNGGGWNAPDCKGGIADWMDLDS